jgi:hypothetical protein
VASAQSFTVNDNPLKKDTRAINTFIEPKIFMNKLIKKRQELITNSTIHEIDSRYDYRPDKLAYEIYGQDFWYPVILIANDLGSILQFKSGNMNFKCKTPSLSVIKNILGLPDYDMITVDTIVDEIFKN